MDNGVRLETNPMALDVVVLGATIVARDQNRRFGDDWLAHDAAETDALHGRALCMA